MKKIASVTVVALAVTVAAPGPAAIDMSTVVERGLLERLLDQQGQGRGGQGGGGQQGGRKQQPPGRGQQGGKQQQQRQQAAPTSNRAVQKQTPARPAARSSEQKETGRGSAQGGKAQRGGGAARETPRTERGAARAEARRGPPETRNVAVRSNGRGRMSRDDVIRQVRALPSNVRVLERSPRASDRLLVGAVALGVARGMGPEDVRFVHADNRLRVFNRGDELLFDMNEQRALTLGAWDMRLLGDQRPRGSAPAFCRSGAGHPVWGRQWCLDKGFGLGSDDRWIWSRRDVDDIVFLRRVNRAELGRNVLIDVLGDVVFGRLALHALTLGFTEPLVGMWIAQPQAPRLLLINSGDYAVAELVDTDYDDRVDVLFVMQPSW